MRLSSYVGQVESGCGFVKLKMVSEGMLDWQFGILMVVFCATGCKDSEGSRSFTYIIF